MNRGFIAFITVIIVSASLMLMALTLSQTVADILDQVTRKHYRIDAAQAALWCLNTVVIELEHDYFYEIDNAVDAYPDHKCSVISVKSLLPGTINKPTSLRNILIEGYSGMSSSSARSITAKLQAQLLIDSQNSILMSEKIFF